MTRSEHAWRCTLPCFRRAVTVHFALLTDEGTFRTEILAAKNDEGEDLWPTIMAHKREGDSHHLDWCDTVFNVVGVASCILRDRRAREKEDKP